MTRKECQWCGQRFEGRANKTYCSQNCKSAMNNGRVAERDRESLSIIQKLNENRRILRALHGVFGETELPESVIQKSGLNFQVNNGRGTREVNSVQILDYIVRKLENTNYKILKTT